MKMRPLLQNCLNGCLGFFLLFAGSTISFGDDLDDLARAFLTPPPSTAPQTWWHWVNGNISKEGITADLEAMKRVGLGGATIVNISELPQGKVDFMSDSWREMVQHAVHESSRLNLELGIENCAGWSSSGGPWITPEKAMQMLVSSEIQVQGPSPFSGNLPQPLTRLECYRDIAVVAYPTPAIEAVRMSDFAPKVTSSDPQFDWSKMSKPGGHALVSLADGGNENFVQFEFMRPYEVRTIALSFGANCKGEIQSSDNGQTFRSLRRFDYYSSNFLIGTQDFEIPTTSARFFRVVLRKWRDPVPGSIAVLQLDLRPAPAVDDFRGKAEYVINGTTHASTTAMPPEMTIDPAKIINLTGQMSGAGQLTWMVPPGNWTVMRFGFTPTGAHNHPAPKEGEGLECDKMSRKALKFHWDQMMAKVISDSGPLAGKTLTHTLIDSYEVGSQNWTAGFEQEFHNRQGYDLLPYLPVLAGHLIGSVEQSERVLWDFRRTIADLFAENYFDYMAELAHQSGLLLSVEPYGDGPFDNLLSGRSADVPMTEFWPPNPGSRGIKAGPMISHIYGKVLAGAESFTAAAQFAQQTPESLKALGDFAFCCGINHMSFHRYAHQPWLDRVPGMTAGPWGSNLERTNTWWEQGRAWISYLTRCQYLLQQGHFVADALVLGQEGSPSNFPNVGAPDGHDWDGCNDDVVLHRLSMRNGRLSLPDGMSYRMLVLPESATMTPVLLRKLQELADNGAVIVGRKPEKSPSFRGYPGCDQEVKTLADELWDGGKISNRSMPQMFASMALPRDFDCSDKTASLQYIHRALGKNDFYFVSNQNAAYEDASCFFRVTGKIPEFWHPNTGLIEKVPLYAEEAQGVSLPLRLDPLGSVFVMFRDEAPGSDHPTTLTATGLPPASANESVLQVRHAVFGSPVDPRAAADVTDKLAALISHGSLRLHVSTDQFGDPAPMIVKQLKVEYLRDGKPGTVTALEGQELNLPTQTDAAHFGTAKLAYGIDGVLELEAWEGGTYEIKTASGKEHRMQVPDVPVPMQLDGPWQIAFPPNRGAPAETRFDHLISWSDHPDGGIQHFSGTATYTKTFSVPVTMTGSGHRLYLDLGKVDVIAELKLNGKDLGIVWKPPFCVDATAAARPGDNFLEVQVTNLWVNRLIGDEQLPPDHEWNATAGKDGSGIKAWPAWLLADQPSPTGHFTFTTWRHWFKDDPLLPSGLLGPVTLHASIRQTVP